MKFLLHITSVEIGIFELLFWYRAARRKMEHNKCKHDPNITDTAFGTRVLDVL